MGEEDGWTAAGLGPKQARLGSKGSTGSLWHEHKMTIFIGTFRDEAAAAHAAF